MFLAAEATTSVFSFFDIIMVLFTIVIAWGCVRLVKQPQKNLFAIGFAFVSLAVFVFSDVVMIAGWLGL